MKKIAINLGDMLDVDRAIQQIAEYRQRLQSMADTLRERLGDEISMEAEAGFDSAIADDNITTEPRKADVTVTVESSGGITVILASGEDAVFVEFGAGVFHNGSVGTSPHPKGAETGFTIGSYPKSHNAWKKAWDYKDASGEIQLTHGTPAVMPLYNAYKHAIEKVIATAREVFKFD